MIDDCACLYAICRGSNDTKEGLYYFDLRSIVETEKINSYFLQPLIAMASLEYSHNIERFAICNSFHQMTLYPLMHKNTLQMLGQPRYHRTLCLKEEK